MKIKPSTAFRINTANRKARAADKPYKVHAVKKDGTPYARPVEYNGAFNTPAEALERADEMARLNPGTAYTVLND